MLSSHYQPPMEKLAMSDANFTATEIESIKANAIRAEWSISDFFSPDDHRFVGLLEDSDGATWAFVDPAGNLMSHCVPCGFVAIKDGQNIKLAIRKNYDTMPDPDPKPGESKEFELGLDWSKARSIPRPKWDGMGYYAFKLPFRPATITLTDTLP